MPALRQEVNIVDTIKLTINGKECTAPEGSTILQAAELNGIHIPRLCYLDGINKYGACRICVVGHRDQYQESKKSQKGNVRTSALKS